ncbi:MAG: hypothetical protein AAF519_15410, partial [Bacteroidota bacterium]
MKVAFVFCLLLLAFPVTSQIISSDWESELSKMLTEFKTCMQEAKNFKCKSTIGESIYSLYGIEDFYQKSTDRHATALEIANNIDGKASWEKLGQAYEQALLDKAQAIANKKQPVLAVYKDETGSVAHVVLVLPGELIPSGSWGLQVPRVASFFTHKPEKSFVDKTLAYAFS